MWNFGLRRPLSFLPPPFPGMPNKARLPHLLKLEGCFVAAFQSLHMRPKEWDKRGKKVWCLCVCPADLIAFFYYESHDIIWFLFSPSPLSFPRLNSPALFFAFICSLLCKSVEAARVKLWTFFLPCADNISPFPPLATAAVSRTVRVRTINPTVSTCLFLSLCDEIRWPKMVI